MTTVTGMASTQPTPKKKSDQQKKKKKQKIKLHPSGITEALRGPHNRRRFGTLGSLREALGRSWEGFIRSSLEDLITESILCRAFLQLRPPVCLSGNGGRGTFRDPNFQTSHKTGVHGVHMVASHLPDFAKWMQAEAEPRIHVDFLEAMTIIACYHYF